MSLRPSGRQHDEMRAVTPERGISKHAEGSCLVRFGDTHVLCTASIAEQVPGLYHAGSVGIIMSGWLGAMNYGVIVANDVDSFLMNAPKGNAPTAVAV